MKRSRHSESQIIKILKEGESGMSVTDICREHGIGEIKVFPMLSERCRNRYKRFCLRFNLIVVSYNFELN